MYTGSYVASINVEAIIILRELLVQMYSPASPELKHDKFVKSAVPYREEEIDPCADSTKTTITGYE